MAKQFREARRAIYQARREIVASKKRAATQVAKEGVKIAKWYSSGKVPRALIKKLHPYAVSRGAPLFSPQFINPDTGDFRRYWRTMQTPTGSMIVNYSSVSGYLAGTDRPRSTMFRRPIDDSVEIELSKIAPDIVRQNIGLR